MNTEQQQCLLGALGYYRLRRKNGSLAIDGVAGPATEEAIRQLEGALGLPGSGIWGKETEAALWRALDRGSLRKPEKGSFWEDPRISPWFRRQEFACPCPRCGGFPAEPAEALVRACAWVRRAANEKRPGTVFLISSGVRCQAHNDELPGSVPDSRHVRGRAVDFCLPGFSPRETLALAKSAPGIRFAYIMKSGWVHMDIGN